MTVLVRGMAEADCAAVAGVRVAGWRFAYRGLLPEAYLAAMSAEEGASAHREQLARAGERGAHLVAERAGEVVGWAAFGPDRSPGAGPGDGELYALYVRPDVVGTGVGRALADEVAARAAALGYGRLSLWVLEGNARGRRFYARAGFAPDGASEPWEVGGATLVEVRYAKGL
ncbi:GNAT family N-acetyltransferase [Streptomyces fradiae]|uniref:GNAT family N-acetyltransferase n=1 Tax=Streptomyces fradiae TaxID=1906 RepID=UPI0029431016|nr:GNAT family N-acetyltransferase [Streptomyces fradiae]WOI61535.1 GNAT family N-acetyltransferase [Streptomyces fradiae]